MSIYSWESAFFHYRIFYTFKIIFLFIFARQKNKEILISKKKVIDNKIIDFIYKHQKIGGLI